MGGFSLIHWIILGVVILLLFGGNRFSAMMGDVAKGLKSFKQGMTEDEAPKPPEQRQIPPQQPGASQPPIDVTPRAADPATPPPPPRDDNAG